MATRSHAQRHGRHGVDDVGARPRARSRRHLPLDARGHRRLGQRPARRPTATSTSTRHRPTSRSPTTRRRSRCSPPTATAPATRSRSPSARASPARSSRRSATRTATRSTRSRRASAGSTARPWPGTARSAAGYVADGRLRDRVRSAGSCREHRRCRQTGRSTPTGPSASWRRRSQPSSRRTATRTAATVTLSFRLGDPADRRLDDRRTRTATSCGRSRPTRPLAAGTYSRRGTAATTPGHIVPRGTYRSVVHASDGDLGATRPCRSSPTRSRCR